MERLNPAEYQRIFTHLILERGSIVPVVGRHLRNQRELHDVYQVLRNETTGSNAALFVGLVGSRLAGKIFLSEKRLATLFRMQSQDPRLHSMAKGLPGQLASIQAQKFADLSQYGISRSDILAATLMHDIDILTIHPRMPLQWRNIRLLSSGTNLDVLSTSVATIVEAYKTNNGKDSFFFQVFRYSQSLR